MKTRLILLLLLLCKIAIAQKLTLTGIALANQKIEINETYDGNYWKKNATYIKADANGRFTKTFNGAQPKWLWIGDEENKRWILLTPGRPLQTDVRNGKLQFSGVAKPENDLIAGLALEDVNTLPFMRELKDGASYAKWSVDSVINIKLPQIMQKLDSTQLIVKKARLQISIEKIIATELHYYYANAIMGDITYWMNQGRNRAAFHERFIDTVLARFAVPTKAELALSPAANKYLESCFRYKFWKPLYAYKTAKNRALADSIFKQVTGASLEQIFKNTEGQNEVLISAISFNKLLPGYAWEKYLNNTAYRFALSGMLQDAGKMVSFIKKNSKDVQLVAAAEAIYAPLKASRDKYAGNLNIRIRPDYKLVSTLQHLLAPYKGKVVLIDMWGTWCPYCIENMAYKPALKKQLAGKDVVFLYLAQDKDKDDEVWRDFIFVNNLTGEHIRLTAEQMPALWNEFGIPDKEWAFPRYLIADRTGKIIDNNAKRPDDGDALYKQLISALEK